MKNIEKNLREKSLFDNWISYLGFLLAVIILIGEAIVIAIDLLQGTPNAYVGILIYGIGPSILVGGLLLVPFGMYATDTFLVIDLSNKQHRMKIVVFSVVTACFLLLTMIGSYQAYHLTESNEFCGVLCHQVMAPEYTAYQSSPHARVDCVQCHIGPGAGWFVQSKLSGTRQVIAVATNSYELPLETPIKNLRPARDTCEQCHWPEKFYSSVEKKMVCYGSDEENTPYRVDLLLHVGGDPLTEETRSIHWHIGLDHTLEYHATDEDRQDIAWIRVTYDDGRVDEYFDEEADVDLAAIPEEGIRVMDCIDCHNRPSHRFHSPLQSVNWAMLNGQLNPKLPELKTMLVDLLGSRYATTKEAVATIEETLQEAYSDFLRENPAMKDSVQQAIATGKELFTSNFFPEWNTDWSKHPWHIGHFEFPGCYRCHDGNHKTKAGKTISADCNLCHVIVRQGEGWDEIAQLEYKEQKFYHPRGFGDDWEGQNCHECHGP